MTPNLADLSRGCKPRIVSRLLLHNNTLKRRRVWNTGIIEPICATLTTRDKYHRGVSIPSATSHAIARRKLPVKFHSFFFLTLTAFFKRYLIKTSRLKALLLATHKKVGRSAIKTISISSPGSLVPRRSLLPRTPRD